MRGPWLGRRAWLWIADGALVVAAAALLITADTALSRFVAVLVLASRLLHWLVIVYVWRARERAAHDPGDDRVVPPR